MQGSPSAPEPLAEWCKKHLFTPAELEELKQLEAVMEGNTLIIIRRMQPPNEIALTE